MVARISAKDSGVRTLTVTLTGFSVRFCSQRYKSVVGFYFTFPAALWTSAWSVGRDE
ncbi:protein of unknown function [Hyphomicrobium sp. MC1]|nr:protein of unknown function [Hyphomicrobium sp. MC1]